jgi:hypothetical protein
MTVELSPSTRTGDVKGDGNGDDATERGIVFLGPSRSGRYSANAPADRAGEYVRVAVTMLTGGASAGARQC